MQPLSLIPTMLLDCATSLNNDDSMPVRVPATTFAFLHQLGQECDNIEKPLARFLDRVTKSQLTESILVSVLPHEYRAIRDELDRIQLEMEECVANHDFEGAATFLKQQKVLKQKLIESTGGPVAVETDHIRQALADLGYDRAISV